MVGSLRSPLVVLPGTEEEEESYPGEVTDGDISWCGVQGLDDVDG